MSANGRVPPGPRGQFLVGNLPEFGRDVLGFFERCARDYGDIVSLRLGSWPALFLNHPDHFETVLLGNNRNFIKHTFFWRHVTEIFGRGLVTNEGAPWLRQRRLMQPAFHRERIAGYGRTMVGYTERMLAAWDAEAEGRSPFSVRRSPGAPADAAETGDRRTETGFLEVDLHDAMMKLTMEIATKTLFGSELPPADAAAIGAAFDDAVVEIANRFRRPVKIPSWLPLPSNLRYAAAVKTLDRLVYTTIARKKEEGGGDDLLTMLMEARDEDGSAMDLRQIRDEAVTIFLAGHETTAIALSWTFHLVARHPAVETKLAEEIRAVLGDREPEAADLPRLPYAGSVVNEAMRLFPPAYAFGREAIADCEIGGYHVSAGTTIFISPWVAHRDARWYDDPLAFRPERWDDGFAKSLARFAYLPFGGGPRVCIGNAFALMEAVLILTSVLRRYRLRAIEGREPKPFPSITLRPDPGMWMRLEPRRVEAISGTA